MKSLILRTSDNQVYHVTDTLKIGRESTCHVCVADKRVSRLHASVTVKDGFLYARDEGSSNGTYVNGVRINRQTLLQPGDQLRVGDTSFTADYVDEPNGQADTFYARTPAFQVEARPSAPPPQIAYPAQAAPPPDEEEEQLAAVPLAATEVQPSVQDAPAAPAQKKRVHPTTQPRRDRRLLWGGAAIGVLAVALIVATFIFVNRPAVEYPTSAADAGGQTGILFPQRIGEQGGTYTNPQGVTAVFPRGALAEESGVDIRPQEADELPSDLTPLSQSYALQLESAAALRMPVEIILPVELSVAAEGATSTRLAAYRWRNASWVFSGGVLIDKNLHFYVDDLSAFRAAAVPPNELFSEYRPVVFINEGRIPLAVRPWKWWFPPDFKLPNSGEVKHTLTSVVKRAPQSYETHYNSAYIGYLHLPYGTYSAWCLSWVDETAQQTLYAIQQTAVPLTRYSCAWEEYRQGRCEIESVRLRVNLQTAGEPGSCASAPALP